MKKINVIHTLLVSIPLFAHCTTISTFTEAVVTSSVNMQQTNRSVLDFKCSVTSGPSAREDMHWYVSGPSQSPDYACDGTTFQYDDEKWTGITGHFFNDSDTKIVGILQFQDTGGDWSDAQSVDFAVEPATRCSVDIDSMPSVPQANGMEVVTTGSLLKNAVGSATVKFTSGAFANGEGLLTMDDEPAGVYSINEQKPDKSGAWVVQSTSEPTLSVHSTTGKAGVMSGTMTATISCE